VIDNTQVEKIQDKLFKDPSLNVYAVIDGAAVKDLRFKLWEMQPEYCCLWAGALEPDMEEVAPYLVKLDEAFIKYLISSASVEKSTIFIKTKRDLKGVRRGLRRVLLVKGAHDESLLFRFYDPRVLSYMCGILNSEQARFFKDVGDYMVLNNDEVCSMRFVE